MSVPLDELYFESQQYGASDTEAPLDECLIERGYVLRSPVELTLLDFEPDTAPVGADVVGGTADVQLEVAQVDLVGRARQ